MSKLYQLHWQFTDGHTEMRSQTDVLTEEEIRTWTKEVQAGNLLPDGAEWLICNDDSDFFVWAACPST